MTDNTDRSAKLRSESTDQALYRHTELRMDMSSSRCCVRRHTHEAFNRSSNSRPDTLMCCFGRLKSATKSESGITVRVSELSVPDRMLLLSRTDRSAPCSSRSSTNFSLLSRSRSLASFWMTVRYSAFLSRSASASDLLFHNVSAFRCEAALPSQPTIARC